MKYHDIPLIATILLLCLMSITPIEENIETKVIARSLAEVNGIATAVRLVENENSVIEKEDDDDDDDNEGGMERDVRIRRYRLRKKAKKPKKSKKPKNSKKPKRSKKPKNTKKPKNSKKPKNTKRPKGGSKQPRYAKTRKPRTTKGPRTSDDERLREELYLVENEEEKASSLERHLHKL
mmetsp:Transcript_762/g.786  ORF Transcript_762/g.786 Transcript_762/m.786 type:complete len:179 (-) Transcript_762:365-901(-)